MPGPFVFVGTHRIKEGKAEAFKADARDLVELVQQREPQLLGFNFYLSDDESEATIVQVHPDAESMLVHMEVAAEHISKGTDELLETKSIQVYGEPNDTVLGMIAQLSQSGVPIRVKPRHLAGFTRGSGQ
jgi:quinol monooxygenase YgiN